MEFAFCKRRICVFVGDEETPDEVIHFAAGLQFSGFKSVVVTLWEVNDAVAKHVVEAFYKYMFRSEGGGCYGLHEGGLGTQLCYTRREDESAARAEDGLCPYWCVVLRRIAVDRLVYIFKFLIYNPFSPCCL
jgi:hypothetical protein